MFRFVILTITLLILQSPVRSDGIIQSNEKPTIGDDLPGGDFTLHSSQGKFSLKQLRGKVVLLYFGYTNCPDVCPTSLAFMSQAMNELNSDELKSVQGVFVSVDPERDTFKGLDQYVSYFHPSILAVTGSENEIAEVAKRYGVQYSKVDLEESSFGYAVDHSSVTYLLTADGELRFLFPHQTPSVVILEAIRYVLGDKE